MLVDEAKIYVRGGDGGNGCISLHREKFRPYGGPDGGDGGKGGSVYLVGSGGMNTLAQFGKRVHFRADKGKHGSGNNKAGRDAKDLKVAVPLGTVVYDAGTGQLIGDVVTEGEELLVAKGGRGGRGNARFATANYRVPHFAEFGEEVEEKWIRLELKSIAHVGLIGLPNAGKSSLLARISQAKPKIADYPFTTLYPNLGAVYKSDAVRYIFADIPGLIEGAHQGAGLGHRFLKHIFRTRILVHLVDLTRVDPARPLKDYHIINQELEKYNPTLMEKPMIIAGNKTDIPGTEEAFFSLQSALEKLGQKCYPISSATGEGVEDLLHDVFSRLENISQDFIREEIPLVEVNLENDLSVKPFTIEKKDGVFYIKGKIVERMVQMTPLYIDEAQVYLYDRFKKMGLDEALRNMGVQPGDTVIIGKKELQFFNEDQPNFADYKKGYRDKGKEILLPDDDQEIPEE